MILQGTKGSMTAEDAQGVSNPPVGEYPGKAEAFPLHDY